ncbi:MAG: DUF1749 domain-containing protein [Candidatus Zambryskibacteria bacterium]|nr:DUF1749 domain-containing protein [Candidatus Zambryskibacteria bacterium]
MNYPIVQVETKDHIWLHGLFLEAEESKTVFLHTHGTASNFYEEYFIEVLCNKLLNDGISMLSVNNRGAGVYDIYQRTGAAVEKFEECLIDLDTWIDFAVQKGYQKIILSGHSLGSEKAVYYMEHGKFSGKISGIVLLGPADSHGSHRVLDGKVNPRAEEIGKLLEEANTLVKDNKGETFLPRNAYGSRGGIMPKSASSFIDSLGPNSKLLEGLPFLQKNLSVYRRIDVPILVVIGDQYEYTAVPIEEALDLMRKENPKTETHLISNCNHDFEGKEEELTSIIKNFIVSRQLSSNIVPRKIASQSRG